MAKGIGLIGSFNGKVGNMVGYSLKDSNNKQTQGVRVHQPVVKNPKTYAQAVQRAKYIPIMELGKRLKLFIQRGNQYLPYGVKSKNAWLKKIMSGYTGPWLTRDQNKLLPPLAQISKGSLPDPFKVNNQWSHMNILFNHTVETLPTTLGELSSVLLVGYSDLKAGDQLTIIACYQGQSTYSVFDYSFVIDENNNEPIPNSLTMFNTYLQVSMEIGQFLAGCVIMSRQGNNGAHIRSNASLLPSKFYPTSYLNDAAKQAAAESYMDGSVNSDWAEESIQE